MLTILMNYIFVFSVGVLAGTLCAYELFQEQLRKELNAQLLYYLMHNFYKEGECDGRNTKINTH